mgnify:CR=1 FL=1
MRDLARFEKELSFESEAYDIYHHEATFSKTSYREAADRIIATTQPKASQKRLSDYIYDFGKLKPSTSKVSSRSKKLKTCSNSPLTPRVLEKRSKKVEPHTEACQEYYGYETPTSQLREHGAKSKRRKESSRKSVSSVGKSGSVKSKMLKSPRQEGDELQRPRVFSKRKKLL